MDQPQDRELLAAQGVPKDILERHSDLVVDGLEVFEELGNRCFPGIPLPFNYLVSRRIRRQATYLPINISENILFIYIIFFKVEIKKF